jgi:hypothetical protein
MAGRLIVTRGYMTDLYGTYTGNKLAELCHMWNFLV